MLINITCSNLLMTYDTFFCTPCHSFCLQFTNNRRFP